MSKTTLNTEEEEEEEENGVLQLLRGVYYDLSSARWVLYGVNLRPGGVVFEAKFLDHSNDRGEQADH